MNNLSRRLTSPVSGAHLNSSQCSTIPNVGLGRYRVKRTSLLCARQGQSSHCVQFFLILGTGGGGGGCTLSFSVSPRQSRKIQVLCSIKQ